MKMVNGRTLAKVDLRSLQSSFMSLTLDSTAEMPWGMMDALAAYPKRRVIDRFGDYVLFWISDDHYIIVGPYAWDDDRAVDHWFGNGWGYSIEGVGDASLAHITRMPNVMLMQRMS